MPLLKKKALKKAPMPEFLKDDEEIFHCEMTNEIFRNYEEFAERTILCNSMVWTCSMTGKSNLTYVEAFQSEENAKKCLQDFPMELRIPVLYLANKTKRKNIKDMAEDVYSYVKDRYFVGENVEASFDGDKWREFHVLQVIAPNVEEPIMSPNMSERNFLPPPSSYKYDLEQLDNDDEDILEKMMVDYTQIRRKKGSYTKEKNKLFLKQYVEQNADGVYSIKESSLESFGVNRIKFSQIFNGPPPDFDGPKRSKNVNGKRVRQETLAKYLTKNGFASNEQKINLIEELKRREVEMKTQKEEQKHIIEEQKIINKQKRKEKYAMMSNLYKEWSKVKEDLDLEDQKKLPEPIEVKCKVPDKYLGDMFMIMEFVNSFSKLLLTKNFFPGGFTFDVIERALSKKEVAGPLIDLIQMLLNAIFSLQEEEASQTKILLDGVSVIKTINKNPTIYDCTKYATVAAKWSVKYHGVPLDKLPLYSLTVSEILRIHLLASGARITETGTRWRFQQRGGYTNEDDPGLYIRFHQPHLIKALAVRNIVELSISSKIKLVSCLINQLLTYADVRDIIEERLENSKQNKYDLKTLKLAEKKRWNDIISAKSKLKDSSGLTDEQITAELDKLNKYNEKSHADYEKKLNKIVKVIVQNQTVLGYDRAFRRYVKLESVPGILVESHDKYPGVCSSEITHQKPEIVNAQRKVILQYIVEQSEKLNTTSNKENTPSKTIKTNGISNRLSQEIATCNDLYMCSSDPKNCIVHSTKPDVASWGFFDNDKFDELILALNPRGIRESELQHYLQMNRNALYTLIQNTPGWQLNPSAKDEMETETHKKTKVRYQEANFGFSLTTKPSEILHSTLKELILEMEAKIFSSNVGSLKIKDRDLWRKCLSDNNYEDFERTIDRRVKNGKLPEAEDEEPESRESTPDFVSSNGYLDPGCTLPVDGSIPSEDCDSDLEDSDVPLLEEQKLHIECMAIALAQIAHAIDSKFLRRPLGEASMRIRDYKNTQIKYNVLPKWEESLLSSTSYSQLFLHYGTLDSCIMWRRSALLARCRACHRESVHEKMVICKKCNHGVHTYCHKPKLDAIPVGEWFCYKCVEESDESRNSQAPKKKKRRIFREEEVDDEVEEMDVDKVSDYENDDDDSDESGNEENENEEAVDVKSNYCQMCKTDGDLLSCEKCSHSYHIECIQPPLRRKPRGQWLCTNCKHKKTHKEDDLKAQRTGLLLNQRRCATRARHKIHNFVKSLRGNSNSDDSDSSVEVSSMSRRTVRREAEDLPLHNAALHDLLMDVMKNEDAWPFIRPVQKNEVPDYYDVITKPMDFGTIKYKLNMGNYTCDEEFMADAVLVFENCNTYNNSDAEVYRCGVRLLKVFETKSRELGLKLPEEMQQDDDEDTRQPKNKKKRRK